MASLLGAATAAAVGGFGTLVVVAAIAFYFPELRRADQLHGLQASVPLEENAIASISGEGEAIAEAEPPRERMRRAN
jgi:hypothetical protein